MKETSFIPAFNYNFLTPFYDRFLHVLGFGDKERERIIKLLGLKKNEKLLDIGCGTGELLLVAKRLYPNNEMVGIDIDENILKIARTKIEKEELEIKFFRSSADNIPFPSASLNTVVSTLAFHHLQTRVKRQSIKEIKRVLKKSGRFLLVDFGKAENLWVKLLYLFERILRIQERETLKDNVEGKIPSYLKEAGFHVKEVAPRYRGMEYLLITK